MCEAIKDLSSLTAVILAGGLGTRIRSVMPDRPKVLAEIHGRPFLTYLLDQLTGAGITYVVLCTGYLGEQVQAMFGDSYGSLHLVYSQELSPLGTAGALRLAQPFFKSDPVLVMNGDSFCQTNLRTFWAWHCLQFAQGTIFLTKASNVGRYGRVHVDSSGLVISFDEKSNKGVSGWINAGIYILSQHLLSTIPVNRAVSLEQEIFPSWIGREFYGYRSEGRFIDIGTPEAYSAAEQFFIEDHL